MYIQIRPNHNDCCWFLSKKGGRFFVFQIQGFLYGIFSKMISVEYYYIGLFSCTTLPKIDIISRIYIKGWDNGRQFDVHPKKISRFGILNFSDLVGLVAWWVSSCFHGSFL